MYFFAYAMQLVVLLAALAGSGLALFQLFEERASALRWIERCHWLISGAFLLISALLLHALFWNDFSVQYVASYTDRILPVFYRLTAFWAGQPGSMLFWALSVAIMGSIFAFTPSYKKLTPKTRLWFWTFFYSIIAFFALILTTWSNPFLLQTPAPQDGNGLNPLLQNPGMIFHPPLLFLGYGGFAVPSCLALAQALSGERQREQAWFMSSRTFIILAWIFLTAGIVLGMWWAYMELGWGGYWAWDPVENASLLPWLIGSAAIHTIIIEKRRGKLARTNVFLMGLCTVSAFFATYLVRSGVIQSVHAFGDGGVGIPLLAFVVAGVFLSLWVACLEKNAGGELENFFTSREGMLVFVAWILLALALIILVATLWPVLTAIGGSAAQGLDANFYNRVCLPLGAILIFLCLLCPWLGWKGGVANKTGLILSCVGILLTVLIEAWFLAPQYQRTFGEMLAWYPQEKTLAFLAAGVSGGALVAGILLLIAAIRRASFQQLGIVGLHIGIILMALGIAVSGPHSIKQDITLSKGESVQVGSYAVTLLDITTGRQPGFDFLEVSLRVERDGKVLGELKPQRRIYDKFGQMQFSEVDVIPGLGEECYAALRAMDKDAQVLVSFSIEPLINWLWIGGTLMCFAPLLLFIRRKRNATVEKG